MPGNHNLLHEGCKAKGLNFYIIGSPGDRADFIIAVFIRDCPEFELGYIN